MLSITHSFTHALNHSLIHSFTHSLVHSLVWIAETQCPDLAPPENGALACLQGNFGVDCLMSCQEPYDVPGVVGRGGHFYCVSDAWIPSTVPGCVGMAAAHYRLIIIIIISISVIIITFYFGLRLDTRTYSSKR